MRGYKSTRNRHNSVFYQHIVSKIECRHFGFQKSSNSKALRTQIWESPYRVWLASPKMWIVHPRELFQCMISRPIPAIYAMTSSGVGVSPLRGTESQNACTFGSVFSRATAIATSISSRRNLRPKEEHGCVTQVKVLRLILELFDLPNICFKPITLCKF